MVSNLVAVGINTSQSWPYFVGLIGISSHLLWQVMWTHNALNFRNHPSKRDKYSYNETNLFQVASVDLSDAKDCLSKFKSNKWLGILLWISILTGTLVK